MIRQCNEGVLADSDTELEESCLNDGIVETTVAHQRAFQFIGVKCKYCGLCNVVNDEITDSRGKARHVVNHKYDGMTVEQANQRIASDLVVEQAQASKARKHGSQKGSTSGDRR